LGCIKERQGNRMKTERQKMALGASVVSAIAASACCIGPLIAVLLGVSGFAAAGVLAKWRPVLLLVTVGLLGVAWYLTYRKPKEACADGSVCATKPVAKWNKVVLWFATVFVVATAAFPMYSGAIARWAQPAQQPTNGASQQLATLKVKIPSMDCDACAVGIEKTLRKQDGVLTARVSYDTKEAVIQYDSQKISRERINATGFKVETKP
jgi:mercuric ion transport protein